MVSLLAVCSLHAVLITLQSSVDVAAGAADARQMEDWATRLKALEGIASPSFGSLAAYREFSSRYLAMLGDPDTLKYAVLLITEGQKQ